MSLSRSEILQNDRANVPRVQVEIPEWGGSVYVRMMTAGERGRFATAFEEMKARGALLEEFHVYLTVLTVCDASGERLYTAADSSEVSNLLHTAIDRIVEAASTLNGLNKEDVEALKKTSSNGPTGDSSSDSPSPSAGPPASSKPPSPVVN